MKVQKTQGDLFERVVALLNEARATVIRNINHTMVCSYYEIGRMIVEEEQQGEHRAEYGERIVIELSKRLAKEFGKGFSTTILNK